MLIDAGSAGDEETFEAGDEETCEAGDEETCEAGDEETWGETCGVTVAVEDPPPVGEAPADGAGDWGESSPPPPPAPAPEPASVSVEPTPT